MFWNEPNNLSHWDFQMDPEWKLFSEMVRGASTAVRAERKDLTQVLGGMSPIDAAFAKRMKEQHVLEQMDAIAVHGFPLDWNHWQIGEWPDKLNEIRSETNLPLWVSEVGVSTFGAEEIQVFGLERTAQLLIGKVERIHWYSLYDLPRAWPATTRHREAEGSSYYRHFYMGLFHEDGSPKLAASRFAPFAPELGICQWFHFEDHRLESAVQKLRDLGVKKLRTGLSWSDSLRPGAEEFYDRQMQMLDEFDTTLTFCYTPNSLGLRPDHTSPPREPAQFADFCARMTNRYC